MASKTDDLWQDFHRRLRGFILKRINNPADVDDVLQEVFLRVYQHLATVKDSERLVSWIFTVARNTVIDYYRKPSRHREVSTDDSMFLNINEFDTSPDDLWSTAELTPHQEMAACLQPMFEQLSEPDREIIQLVELEGISQRTAAEQLGLSISGAKSRVQRSRQKLKAMLLSCCNIEFDAVGNVVDYTVQQTTCHVCGSMKQQDRQEPERPLSQLARPMNQARCC